MTKVRWTSKQFTRFDLALTKFQRPLSAVNTISNFTVAATLAGLLLGMLGIIGFLGLTLVGYALDKSGFFKETRTQRFKQEDSSLWDDITKLQSAYIAHYENMSPEDLKKEIERLRKVLDL